MKKLIAGNWKMNLNRAEAEALAGGLCEEASVDVLVCPPFIYVDAVMQVLKDSAIMVGGQDCSIEESGAFTGQVSGAMLADIGCSHVIVGHSERRQHNNESDDIVRMKAAAALAQSVTPIICVGETAAQREGGEEKEIVGAQIKVCLPEGVRGGDVVIAYEPVWAIGTGKVASAEDVRDMHGFIREVLKESLADSDKVRILYGGSMKPTNAAELLATDNVDGGLIGGASLTIDDFMAIINAAKE